MGVFTQNVGWKLVSLAAAFFIWLNIAGEPELVTILSAPVEYKNNPKGLEISSTIVESVEVEARGPSGQLRDLNGSRITAVVDFSSVNAPGERTITLTSAQINLPAGIQLIRVIPAQLRFRFERRTTKVLNVEVPYSGTLSPGLVITGTQIVPPTLTIAGPESRVAAVERAVTDPFDLSQVTGDTEQKLSVYIAEPQVRFVSVPQVTVKVRVKKSN